MLPNLPIILGVVAGFNVFLGGLMVLKFKRQFRNILGFSGGVMLGVVAIEVIPEIFELSASTEGVNQYTFPAAFLLGILFFHTISYFFPLHEHGHHDGHDHTHHFSRLSFLGSFMIVLHSFVDGVGIGLGFKVSSEVGIAVAIAVLAHNLSDGINTVSSLLLGNYQRIKRNFIFTLNILAPILGIVFSFVLEIPSYYLIIFLSIFSGSILYLAISDILPNAHNDKNQKLPIFMTIFGVIFVYITSFFI